MSLETDFFWHYFNAIAADNSEQLTELEPEKEMDNELQRIIFRIEAFTPSKSHTLKSYIRKQQGSITRLIFRMEDCLLSAELKDSSRQSLHKLLDLCEKLIDYLMKYYPKAFDFTMPVSAARRDAHSSIKRMRCNELRFFNNNSALATLLVDSLLNEENDMPLRFSSINYELCLLKLLKKGAEKISSELDLHKFLILIGYQPNGYYEVFKNFLTALFLAEGSLGDRYKLITSLRKEIAQLPKPAERIFISSSQSMKKQLLNFLDEELAYLKGMDFVTNELINTGLLDSNFKVSLSVRQLAFYVFLNVECGIITEQRAKRIHEYVVKNVSTADRTEISEKSFKNAYYLHAPEDIKKVIERLGKMLALAQSHL